MKHIASTLAAFLVLAACTSPVSPGAAGFGRMRLAVAWPQAIPAHQFRVQLIPDDTDKLRIRISGEGLTDAREEVLSRSAGEQQVLDLSLPAGPKTVAVVAEARGGQALAQDSAAVVIRQNQTSRLEMDLKPTPVAMLTPSPSPTPGGNGTGNGSGNGSGSGSGKGGSGSETPTGVTRPDARPSSLPGIVSELLESGLLTSSGGSSSNAPKPTELLALPETVSGLGYPSELLLLIPAFEGLTSEVVSWTCTDLSTDFVLQTRPGCDNFTYTGDPRRVIWQAPLTTGGPYEITVSIDVPERKRFTRSVTIKVIDGTGSLEGNNLAGPGQAGVN